MSYSRNDETDGLKWLFLLIKQLSLHDIMLQSSKLVIYRYFSESRKCPGSATIRSSYSEFDFVEVNVFGHGRKHIKTTMFQFRI